jgi:hypothetical protein
MSLKGSRNAPGPGPGPGNIRPLEALEHTTIEPPARDPWPSCIGTRGWCQFSCRPWFPSGERRRVRSAGPRLTIPGTSPAICGARLLTKPLGLRIKIRCSGGSSNGRTADSGSAYLGSNPSPPATFFLRISKSYPSHTLPFLCPPCVPRIRGTTLWGHTFGAPFLTRDRPVPDRLLESPPRPKWPFCLL